MSSNDRALIIFTRYPQPGKTKTRLETLLSPEQCAQFHWACLEDISTQIDCLDADIYLLVDDESEDGLHRTSRGHSLRNGAGAKQGRCGNQSTPDSAGDGWGGFARLFPEKEDRTVKTMRQAEGDLGKRMLSGFDRAFSDGYSKVVLIGADSPELTKDELEHAFDELDFHDLVIKPVHDGGYSLIGASRLAPEIFQLGSYGHEKVFTQTAKAAKRAGYDLGILEIGYDIDSVHDLEAFCDRAQAQASREYRSARIAIPETPSYSVVIPVYNEMKELNSLLDQACRLALDAEVILVDGSSTDGTYDALISKLEDLSGKGAWPNHQSPVFLGQVEASDLDIAVREILDPEKPFRPGIRIMRVDKGRGNQLDAGALASRGDRLLFLHADSLLPDNPLKLMDEAFESTRAGCFGVRFPMSNILMLTNRIASNIRARRGVMFGDQGIFIDRKLFFEAGMFPDIPLMEDYRFSLTLKEMGIKTLMANERLTSSSRRYPKSLLGTVKVMRNMFKLRKDYRNGVCAEALADRYPDIR